MHDKTFLLIARATHAWVFGDLLGTPWALPVDPSKGGKDLEEEGWHRTLADTITPWKEKSVGKVLLASTIEEKQRASSWLISAAITHRYLMFLLYSLFCVGLVYCPLFPWVPWEQLKPFKTPVTVQHSIAVGKAVVPHAEVRRHRNNL